MISNLNKSIDATPIKFENKINSIQRYQSTGKLLQNNFEMKERKQQNNSNFSNKENDQSFCNRLKSRHKKSEEKITKMRLDKFNNETINLTFTPQISKNSKSIVEKLIKKEKKGEDTKKDYIIKN